MRVIEFLRENTVGFISSTLFTLIYYCVIMFFCSLLGVVESDTSKLAYPPLAYYGLASWIFCGAIFNYAVYVIVEDDYCPFASAINTLVIGFLASVLGPFGFLAIPIARKAS